MESEYNYIKKLLEGEKNHTLNQHNKTRILDILNNNEEITGNLFDIIMAYNDHFNCNGIDVIKLLSSKQTIANISLQIDLNLNNTVNPDKTIDSILDTIDNKIDTLASNLILNYNKNKQKWIFNYDKLDILLGLEGKISFMQHDKYSHYCLGSFYLKSYQELGLVNHKQLECLSHN